VRQIGVSACNQRPGKPALVTCNQMVMKVLTVTSNYKVTRNEGRTGAGLFPQAQPFF